MIIAGMQKLTLLDYPHKIAATLFTPGCNFRCPFCHNSPLVTAASDTPLISEMEVLAFLESRIGILDGVCITGGEPLMQKDIASFIQKIKSLGFLVKLDTNGSFYSSLKALIDDRLVDYVAMDIKNSPEKYEVTAASSGMLSEIEKSVALLLEGHVEYEFRTTVVKEFHTQRDFESIGRWIKGADLYVLQNFEDSENVIQKGLSSVTKETLVSYANVLSEHVSRVEIRGV